MLARPTCNNNMTVPEWEADYFTRVMSGCESRPEIALQGQYQLRTLGGENKALTRQIWVDPCFMCTRSLNEMWLEQLLEELGTGVSSHCAYIGIQLFPVWLDGARQMYA